MFGASLRARRVNRLALVALSAGDNERCRALATKAFEMLPERRVGLVAATNRAAILMTLAAAAAEVRDHEEAASRLRDAVRGLEAAPASATRDVWRTEVLTRLGDTLRLAGHYPEARAALETAWDLAESSKAEPLRKAAVQNALGILSKDTGHFQEAEGHYAQTRGLMEDALGPGAPGMAGLHHNLAGLLHVQGHYFEAEPEIRKAMALRQREDPVDVPALAADTSVLGAILAGQDRLAEAEEALREALSMWEQRFGSDHYEVAVQLHNVASVQHKRGDLEGADRSYHRALQIKTRVLGLGHREIGALLNNIAALRHDQGLTAEANRLYAEALQIFEVALGPEHPDTKICAANLAREP